MILLWGYNYAPAPHEARKRFSNLSYDTVWRETFEGENFHKFRDFTATHESFLHEILGMPHPSMRISLHSTKVFSAKCSLPTDPRRFSPSKVSRYTVLNSDAQYRRLLVQHQSA